MNVAESDMNCLMWKAVECVESFLLCIVGKMAQDVWMMQMCCGVPILFGWFLRVSSLHVLVSIRKPFCDLFLLLLYCFLEIVRREAGKGRCMVCNV